MPVTRFSSTNRGLLNKTSKIAPLLDLKKVANFTKFERLYVYIIQIRKMTVSITLCIKHVNV